jgi:protein O-mannosyl-transferase
MPTAKFTRNHLFAAICLVLAIGTFILYWPVTHNGFTNFDDGSYITENPHVTSGLNWSNIVWSFTHVHAGYWIPLTWILHMMNCQLFGLNAGLHHLVSVFFHIANTLLLFLWLWELTGAIWRSAFVAALFAWHPLHVESVAWACELKDVLSTLFWMLVLIVYTRYVKARQANHLLQSRTSYALALFLFACGLMSKPMVVTLPFVLLLLDFWPLKRLTVQKPEFIVQNMAKLVLEKIPFFVLGAAASLAIFLTTRAGNGVSTDTFSYRLANALWGYVRYISKIFWPADLAVFYPLPAHAPIGLALVAVLLLATCSIAFIFLSRERPYFLVGWFWFLGTLVPVIGIIQAGLQSIADRFTYIPSIGLFILLTWALADFFKSWPGKISLAAAGATALAACLFLTSIQITYWRNSITLFRHALAVTTDNYVACACLGQALEVAGDEKNALIYCRQAVQINADYPPGQFFWGIALWKEGDTEGAFTCLNAAAQATPHDPIFQYNLGKFLLEHGSPDKAAARFTAALEDDPDFAEAHNALGKTFLQQGQLQRASAQLSKASALEPGNAQFHYDLGTVLLAASQPVQAIGQFSEAVHLQPDFALAQQNLAVALAGQGKLAEAITHFSKEAQLQSNDPDAHFNLGFAYLNNHQPSEAAAEFSEELRLAPNEAKGHFRLAEVLREENKLPEAVFHYRQALKLTPNFPEAKKELDDILAAHPELGKISN